jgi:hypothetical protein
MTKANMIETIFNRTELLLEKAERKEKVYGNDSHEHNEARKELTAAICLIYDLELRNAYVDWQVQQIRKAKA